jgi:hypothetical protein
MGKMDSADVQRPLASPDPDFEKTPISHDIESEFLISP